MQVAAGLKKYECNIHMDFSKGDNRPTWSSQWLYTTHRLVQSTSERGNFSEKEDYSPFRTRNNSD